jgi:MFS family permease
MGRASSMRKVGVAAFVGALVEWYDYFLYGLAAGVVFNQLFFPSENPLTGTLAAFATFGVGFLFRPVEGAIFGHYGDKLGRKTIREYGLRRSHDRRGGAGPHHPGLRRDLRSREPQGAPT